MFLSLKAFWPRFWGRVRNCKGAAWKVKNMDEEDGVGGLLLSEDVQEGPDSESWSFLYADKSLDGPSNPWHVEQTICFFPKQTTQSLGCFPSSKISKNLMKNLVFCFIPEVKDISSHSNGTLPQLYTTLSPHAFLNCTQFIQQLFTS